MKNTRKNIQPTLLEIELAERIARAERRVLGVDATAGSAAAGTSRCPPLGNTGGKYQEAFASAELPQVRLVLENGEVKQIPQRFGHGGSLAFIDWVNVTVHDSSFYGQQIPVIQRLQNPDRTEQESIPADDHVLILSNISHACENIFGFGITGKRSNGANFYKHAYTLGDGWGLMCIGGQRSTVLLSLSGAGCAAAKPGWEKRLQAFLHRAISPRITRVDLAYDDYAGSHSIDEVDGWHDAGLFNTGGRNPVCEQRGDWKNPNGKGRSFYVGNRSNGKYYRGYEKGKQLGAHESPWVRHEVEIKGVDRVIPFDVLTEPGAYLAATYPALAFISERQERILTTQKTVQITYEKMVDWLGKQCGRAMYAVQQIEGSAEKALSRIIKEKLPKRLIVPTYHLSPPAITTGGFAFN